jgi:hypothetical protein
MPEYEEGLRLLVIEPDESIRTPIWGHKSAAEIRGLVGGHVEPIYLNDAMAYVREDGQRLDLMPNALATKLARASGAHPRDLPLYGLCGTVVFAGRALDGSPTSVPAPMVSAAMTNDWEATGSGQFPAGLTVPGGVYLKTEELMFVSVQARRAGCPILIPDHVFMLLQRDEVVHIVTNQSKTARFTPLQIPYLRCHASVAMFVDEKPRPQPYDTYMDIPLNDYISLPVPAKWDPTHADFEPSSGERETFYITVGELMREVP